MKKLLSKTMALLIAVCVLFGTFPIIVSAAEVNTGANLYENGLSKDIEGGTILHCWCWNFNTIREKMSEIAAAGFSAIQTSPICEVNNGGNGSLTISGGDNWWWHYQPTDYKIGNYQLGTKAEFRAMCEAAHSYGIKVIVDSVLNHCSADYSKISDNVKNLAGASFHPMGDWNELDRYDMTQYDLSDLYDLNTQNQAVQDYLLAFLKDCVDNGADGFRFDAAKHIELPDDTSSKHGNAFASDFWPTILQNGATFQYGEILQEGGRHFYNNSRTGYDDNDSSRLSAYQSQTFTDQSGVTRYMNTTNSFTGHRIRDAISNRNLSADHIMDTLLPKNALAERTVTWVESHDNYCNESSYSQLNEQQVIQGWAAIAARKDGTPLFFDRPKNSTSSSPWGNNKIGPEGSEFYKDPQVVAVNYFRNEMGDTPQTATNPISGNTQVLMIERGDNNKGVVIINAGDDDVVLHTATGMADGSYSDQALGGAFEVSGGILTGTVRAGRVAVVYHPETSESDKESFYPAVELSPASGYFFTETLDAEVNVRGCDHSAYALTLGGSTVSGSAVTGDVITISGLKNNESATLTLTGYDADNQVLATVTRTYTKWIKLNNTIVYMDSAARSSWNQCYAYIWGSSENKGWPGEKMELTSDGLYRYVLPYQYEIPGSYGNVIFNNGNGQQFDAGRITPGQKMIYTADGKWLPYEEPVAELLGDADGNGRVSIFDATCIQRWLASLPNDKFVEAAADADQNGKIAILDATCIQRWLASLPSNDNIGKPITEVYKTKSVPVLRSSLDSTETATLRVYADQPNVPYVNIEDFYNQFYLVNTDLTDGMTCTVSGAKYTMTNIAGNTAVFDVAADTIYVDNLEDFTTSAYSLQVAMAGGVDEYHPFIKQEEVNEPADPTPLTLSLGDYGIDLRGDETGVYAPLATVSDIFAGSETYRVVYTGKKIYTADYSGVYVPTPAIKTDPDYVADVEMDHPADLADFTYRELCFNIDLWYGQPGQEWVHDDLQTMKLDELLTAKYPDIKENLCSTEFASYYEGLMNLVNGILFDGGHTTLEVSPLFAGDIVLTSDVVKTMLDKDYGQKYIATQLTKPAQNAIRTATRDAAYGDDYYLELGDTAMIHFDSFVTDFEGWKAFYAGAGERPLKFSNGGVETYDTVGVVLTGLERAKQNPAIKNIIIDMSCNGGGDSGAMLAIEWLMTGKDSIAYESRLTGRNKTVSAQFDMNFDGVFDENDVSPYTDFHYGVLTSSYAFSCGNAYPWYMHKNGAMILGQRTSGGACAIRITSAAGVEFACSAASSHIVVESGENVDFGCPVDADLLTDSENPYENFYDLSLLSQKMNEFFAVD